MKIIILLISFFNVLFYAYSAPIDQKKIYETQKTTTPPVLDGVLNDDAWQAIDWTSDFTQRRPNEGMQPTQKTAFKILYDDNNLYVAIRAFDSNPDLIVDRMSRRDGFEGDWVEISIDSYHDKRTAFAFTASASGVKSDLSISGDGNSRDDTWDPIWFLATSIDDEGWIAEFKIPLDQLRFSNEQEQTWGIQVVRKLFRTDETSVWQFVAQDAPGWVSYFGELNGIRDIKPSRNIELSPYSLVSYETYPKEDGNPFMTGTKSKLNFGLDGKIGITNDLTLDLTVNPDFGQVEADPSEVNLTAFETYLQEKRPFFIEGKDILNFQVVGGGSPLSRDNLFYSRRIGRSPQYSPSTNTGEYLNQPTNTTILGAVKLTGKTQNGVSIGALETLTAQEEAEIDMEGKRRFMTVEPMTNYSMVRIQKDMNEGGTVIGGMITSVNRKLEDDYLIEILHKNAYTGGLDVEHSWKDKTYYIKLNTVFSHVEGSADAIYNTQLAPQRYFQRPDATHLEANYGRTSLNGHGGTIQAGKGGNGKWRYMAWLTWRSPELELNDMGFLRRGDELMQVAWVGYSHREPFSIFRYVSVNSNQWAGWNFAGTNLYKGGNINANAQFKNYWFLGVGSNIETEGFYPTALRGGPMLKVPGNINYWVSVSSDERKKLQVDFNNWQSWSMDGDEHGIGISTGITYRPINTISITASPDINLNKSDLQYVTTLSYNDSPRYIVSDIDQKVVSISLRINYSVTPNLSIQYWGQPFFASGKYSEFKYITQANARTYENRFQVYDATQISYDPINEIYAINENSDLTIDYIFDKPDWNVFEYRSNLVARWEYTPGSTLYVVWSQGKSGYDSQGLMNFTRDTGILADQQAHNVFMIKFSYRFKV